MLYFLIIGYYDDSKSWVEFSDKQDARDALKDASTDKGVAFARLLSEKDY